MKFKFLNKALLIESKDIENFKFSKKNFEEGSSGKRGHSKFSKKIFVIGDLHIGYEEAMNKVGVFIPRTQFKEVMEELEGLFVEVGGKVDEVVILGDLKHEFGAISVQEWKDVGRVLDFLKKKSKKIVLVKGNHDTVLGPVAKRNEVEIKDYYIFEDICFFHGDKLFPETLGDEIKYFIVGHRHPAVTLQDEYKREKYKCFLKGKWKKKEVIILPSFFPLIEGSDFVDENETKMFIPEKELKNFDVYVIGDEVYKFGKLKKLVD